MGKLVGLEGTTETERDCLFIEKASEIEVVLRNGYAASSADDNGAINIWVDDEGKYRCVSMRWCVTQESRIYKKISSAINWAEKWLALIK